MIAALIRGLSQLVAAISGLLLVLGVTYAMEAMTTRLPMGAAAELVISTTFMLPWTLLFCSGFHDLSTATKREWLFWAGSLLVVGLLYYFNRHTTEMSVTKGAMPVLACGAAAVPHVFRRLSFSYSIVCILFGLCGLAAAWSDIVTFTTASSYATSTIAVLMVVFPLAAISAAGLSIASFFNRRKDRSARSLTAPQ